MWLENLKPMADLASILAGFGLITVLLAILKRNAERRCWRQFKRLVERWIDYLRESENRHPRELSEGEWKAVCERMLTSSRFAPSEAHQLLDTAVIVAKGIAAEKFFM